MQKPQIAEFDPPLSGSPACSILVVSCDRYRDLWAPFFTLFQRYWPDCDMPVYLGANFVQAEFAGVRTLKAGDDESWSKGLRFFLENIQTEYVLLMLEDFFHAALSQPPARLFSKRHRCSSLPRRISRLASGGNLESKPSLGSACRRRINLGF